MESALTARAVVSSLESVSAACGLRLSRSKNEKVDMVTRYGISFLVVCGIREATMSHPITREEWRGFYLVQCAKMTFSILALFGLLLQRFLVPNK